MTVMKALEFVKLYKKKCVVDNLSFSVKIDENKDLDEFEKKS